MLAGINGGTAWGQQSLAEKSRQFDFWHGEWDVNLRIFREGQWKDQIQGHATIYSILDGRATMELWDSPSLKGFSIRYYDEATKKWELWLNWPQPNASRWAHFEGAFRNGRCEFFTDYINNSDTMRIRYTFSDITNNSLRWDDGYSRDRGKTWSVNWIMEFSRTAEEAPWSNPGEPLNTFSDHSLCTESEYNHFEKVLGFKKGELEEDGKETPIAIESHPILDGCAIISFITTGNSQDDRKMFIMETYNEARGKLALYVLSNDHASTMTNYYWSDDNHGFVTETEDQKVDWDLGDNPALTRYSRTGDGFTEDYTIRFGGNKAAGN